MPFGVSWCVGVTVYFWVMSVCVLLECVFVSQGVGVCIKLEGVNILCVMFICSI